jgi:hypothetical protein
VAALQAARLEVATHLGWTRERRAPIVVRLDGGLGTTEVLTWLLRRGEQGVTKISPRGRGQKLRQAVGPWQPTSRPGREMAEVRRPHRFCRTTRHWGMRTPQDQGGFQEAVGLTTLPDLAPATVADAYDSRVMLEATVCQEKQALGFVKRRQPKWPAQQRGVLCARWAPHLLLWSKRWLSRVPTTRGRFDGYGLGRRL